MLLIGRYGQMVIAQAPVIGTPLVGQTLAQSGIREKTGCTVVAIEHQGKTFINPEPSIHIGKNDELVLIGTYDAESSFLSTFNK